jgi:putative SOS response-associated peptidase YedK
MCGRYTLTRQEKIVDDLQASLAPDVLGSEWWKPRFNVAPTQPSPVVTLHDGTRTVELMRWGLVPFWATKPGAARPPLMINARLENLHAKQWFREALDKRRCLVPADGFFEWKKRKDDPKHPQPIWLRPESGKVFAFAGLYAKATAADGSEQLSFTIITCPPNELVKPIHDRMPLVLSPDTYASWLDPLVGEAGARALLDVPPVGDWRGVPVSTHVNKATNDDPQCIEPVEPPAKPQLSLF